MRRIRKPAMTVLSRQVAEPTGAHALGYEEAYREFRSVAATRIDIMVVAAEGPMWWHETCSFVEDRLAFFARYAGRALPKLA